MGGELFLPQLMHVGFIAMTIIAIYAASIQLKRIAAAGGGGVCFSALVVPWMLLPLRAGGL